MSVLFQGKAKDIAGKVYLLFAVWPASFKQSCDGKAKYSRSGCKLYGYVLGDEANVNPITAYPGIDVEEHEGGGETWTRERWLVERFR